MCKWFRGLPLSNWKCLIIIVLFLLMTLFLSSKTLGSQCLELLLSPQQVDRAGFLLKLAKDVFCFLNHQFCLWGGISCIQGKEFYKCEKLGVCATTVPLFLIQVCVCTYPRCSACSGQRFLHPNHPVCFRAGGLRSATATFLPEHQCRVNLLRCHEPH